MPEKELLLELLLCLQTDEDSEDEAQRSTSICCTKRSRQPKSWIGTASAGVGLREGCSTTICGLEPGRALAAVEQTWESSVRCERPDRELEASLL